MPELLKWILISALPILFYPLKATNIIVYIAIFFVELFLTNKKNIYKIIFLIIGSVLVFTVSETISFTTKQVVEYQVNEDVERDIKWYLLLGSNYDHVGNWNYEDEVLHSFQLKTKKEKDETVPQVILDRYQEMGISGIIGHWMHKTQLFYNDGTFSWRFNGTPSKYSDDNSKITQFMRNVMWSDGSYGMSSKRPEGRQYGEYYKYFVIYQQIVWMTVYTYLGIFILLGNYRDKSILVLKVV